MSSGSHYVSLSPFSFHIKEGHDALSAHLTLKLSSGAEFILPGKLMSPAGNSLLLQGAPIEKKKQQTSCSGTRQSRLQPGSTQRGKAGRQTHETDTGHVVTCRNHTRGLSFPVTGEAIVQYSKAIDCLISRTTASVFTEAAALAEMSAGKTAARRG